MAISTPVNLGFTGSASTPSSLAITTGNAISANDTVVVWHYSNATNSTATSVTDSSSNTYVRLISSTAVAPLLEVYICYKAASMASSSSITIPSFANSALRHGMSAWTITGLANSTIGGAATLPLDPHTTTASNVVKLTSGTTSTSIPINNSYSNVMLLVAVLLAGASMGTVTQGGSFTTLGGGTTNAGMYPAYQIVASTAAVTYAPSWTSGQIAGAFVFALFGAPAANTSRQAQGMLTGVGV